MFDIIGLFWKWEDHPNVIPADEIKESEKSANIYAALKDLGYETTNAFTNLTTVGLTIFFYYFKVRWLQPILDQKVLIKKSLEVTGIKPMTSQS